MVQLKYRGFLSNRHVMLDGIFFLAIIGFGNLSAFFIAHDIILNLIVTSFVFVTVPPILYFSAPMAYKRVYIDEAGIKCGREFISFSDIRSVNIVSGYIRHWYGFPFLERTLGITQSYDVYAGEIVCINCTDFDPDDRKSKNIYVGKNKKSLAVLKKYCEQFRDVLK